jgi:ABC-type amino acid transport substrate-binding protein
MIDFGPVTLGLGKERRQMHAVPKVAVLIAVTALVIAGCGGSGGGGNADGTDPESIVVASSIDYRPFEFEKDGEPVGFDIDLMRAIGKRAGFEPKFQNVTFDGIIPGLGNNLYDAAISAITITPEREKQIDFSEPYYSADQSLLVRSDSGIRSTDDLADATVGVQIGTTGAAEAKRLAEQGKVNQVRTFDGNVDAMVAVENGQIAAVITDLPASADRVKSSDGALEIAQTIPTGEQYGIAFPKDSEFRESVNKALQEIKDDGTYAEIYEKWFGKKPEDTP